MKVIFLVLAACGLAAAAPQNWPYRDSLMPYRYGYPSQTQYKYLPQIEDDEDVGPYLSPGKARHDVAVSRQDVVVGSDGDRVRPTPDTSAPGVVETGSVAPVVEPTKAPVPVQPTRVPGPPAPRPIGPDGGNRPVQPPVFPPARPPPTPAPVEKEEDEEDDESDEEADADPEADDESDVEDAGDDEEPTPDDDDNEEEEEEERRRQVPLNSDETVEVAPVVPVVDKVKTAVVAAPPAPVVVAPVNKTQVVVPDSVEDVNPPVDSNEVARPDSDDDSSEEQGLGDGVEALVPGYVTEQGEVLVPVDTVSGDQPISIVPDPYSPPARGIPIRGGQSFQSHYDDIGYSNPYYFSEELYDGVGRQDDSDDTDVLDASNTDGDDDEDKPSDEEADDEEGPEGRNEFLTDFPPSRTPELYALINPRASAQQGYFAGQNPQQRYQQNRYQGPYAYQGAPIVYRVRPQQTNPSVSLAIRVNGGNGNNNVYNPNPYVNRFAAQQQFVDQEPEQYQPEPVLRGPYSPVYNRPQNRPYTPYNPYVGYRNRPQYSPSPRPFYPGPNAYGPRPVPIYAGPGQYRPAGPGYNTPRPIRPVYRPQYSYSEGPVFIKRRPIAASITQVNLKTKRPIGIQSVQYSKFGPSKFAPSKRRPTPVDYQDDDLPYPFVNPFGPNPQGYEQVPVADADTSASDSVEEQAKKVVPVYSSGDPRKPIPVANKTPVVPAKSRRAAKMAKKTNKKDLEKKKKLTDPDPLNILKKISVKRN